MTPSHTPGLEDVTIADSDGSTETLRVTAGHPFYVDGLGWTEAGELKKGESLDEAGGRHATVSSLTTENDPHGVTVYNFTVAEDHTYFVDQGGAAVWVHNTCLKGKAAIEAAGKLGFDKRVPTYKLPFDSHGQPGFFDGTNYITPDVDSHVGGSWKLFDWKGRRLGTLDSDGNLIGD